MAHYQYHPQFTIPLDSQLRSRASTIAEIHCFNDSINSTCPPLNYLSSPSWHTTECFQTFKLPGPTISFFVSLFDIRHFVPLMRCCDPCVQPASWRIKRRGNSTYGYWSAQDVGLTHIMSSSTYPKIPHAPPSLRTASPSPSGPNFWAQ
jgi:hypothetical protein